MNKYYLGFGFTLDRASICCSKWRNGRLTICRLLQSDPSFSEVETALNEISRHWKPEDQINVTVFSCDQPIQRLLDRWQKTLKQHYGVSLKVKIQKPALSPSEAPVLIGFSLRDGRLAALSDVDMSDLGEALREIESDSSGNLSGSARAQAVALGVGEPLSSKLRERVPSHSIQVEFIEPTNNRFTWF